MIAFVLGNVSAVIEYRILEPRLADAPPVVRIDAELHDGDVLRAGAIRLRCMHTPGHTPGSVSFAIEADDAAPVLLTGDTLFRGAVGRWDLGGTSLADIITSIETKLLAFDDATVVVPGHGPLTTVGVERATNPFLRGSGSR